MDERGHFIREAVRDLFRSSGIIHDLAVDSRALFDKISMFHGLKEYRLQPTVIKIRN